jgi:hypothetical protein
MDETDIFMLRKYTRDSGVTRSEATQYASIFPARAMRTMIESGIAYDLT